ncbi:MAG TPA: Gfo/Idh/MocA family oxidoreductase [Gemmatimonadales bacterium]
MNRDPVPPVSLKLGFAGCGEVAVEKHLPALAEVRGIEVVAVADSNPARLRIVEKRFGIGHRYDTVDRLLAHPGLDAVALCLPPACQAAAALAALDAGKHLWIDPPAALSLAEYDQLRERASRSRQVVLMGFHMRWHRLVRQAREIVRSGRLGTIQTLRAVWNSPRNPRTEPEWRRRRALGGGALVEIAMDHFDLWRYLLDSEIGETFALHFDGQTEDEAAVVSGRMASGVLLSAVLSERTSHDLEIEIGGTAGRLRVACIRFEGLEFYPASTMPSALGARVGRMAHFLRELPRALPRMHRAGDYRASYEAEWSHFLDCIAGTATPASTLDDGRRAMAVVLASFESTRTGRPAIPEPA